MMKQKIFSQRQIRIKSLAAFSIFILGFCVAVFAWKRIRLAPQPDGIPSPLRKGLSVNEALFSRIFNPQKLLPVYPKSEAVKAVRVNGNVGMRSALESTTWRLKV